MNLPSVYEPGKYEEDIYKLWEESKVFTPKRTNSEESYSIMMPLPNANGRLHIGSVLFVTLQDIVSRYQRMKGKQVLWLPGADHAGFETWVVYEKKLNKEGRSRFDYSREELYKQVWDFVASNRKVFEQQFRELGASVDWTRFTFSLDEKIVNQVYKTFKKMWDDGLVYRGERIVNYCTYHGTSFADIEVEYKDVDSHLWHIAYPLTDASGEVVVATTRPETMLGDVAVAVNPSDDRYKKYIGKTVKLPLTNREIPIIADEFVDSNFGTGAVKLTPAHDPVDFEAGQRHDLPMISVIDHEGNMTHHAPEPYRGLAAEEARKKVVDDLEKAGLIKKIEEYSHSVGHCYKCGNVIQPLLLEQWFVDMKPLAARAIDSLKEKKIKFYPDSKRTQLIRYLDGLKDWNISRQIAWGIPIPAFRNVNDDQDWIYDERVGEEEISVDGKTYVRDPDVFDTWFSSGQWPFAALGLDSQDFEQFYPTSLMETGGEILYPWVSRMIMLGLYMTDEVPFEDVYIHGYVLAADGAKMSKSLGNIIDPDGLRIKYGADALRLGIIDGRAPAINRPFDETKAKAGRNFCNKLWNISRYIEGAAGQGDSSSPKPNSPADHWILNKLSNLTEGLDADLSKYRFGDAYLKLYHFVWDDLADWYIEASKTELNPGLLKYVLKSTLIVAHPFAPFITEVIWQNLGHKELLATQLLPKISESDKSEAGKFKGIKELIAEIRMWDATTSTKAQDFYYGSTNWVDEQRDILEKLARLENISHSEAKPSGTIPLTSVDGDFWLRIDRDAAKPNLEKLLANYRQSEKLLKRRLDSPGYKDKAPQEIVAQTEKELVETSALASVVEKQLKSLED